MIAKTHGQISAGSNTRVLMNRNAKAKQCVLAPTCPATILRVKSFENCALHHTVHNSMTPLLE